MGTVYKAWDPGLRRKVAVKTLLPDLANDQESRQRFLREAQSIASITHPHIIQIFSIEEKDGIPFFAMEYVEGKPLDAILTERQKLPPGESLNFMSQTARGLQEAQRQGIVHRDIKPANLLLTTDGTVKITDFGLAKEIRANSGLTSVGIVMGSPNYMSPEQGRGEPVDHRSDIYSLGVTFFEMITGRLPFDAPTPMAMILKHTREPAPSAKQFSPKVSYPLARTIQKMLAKRPADRYQNYQAFLQDLDMAEKIEKKTDTPADPKPQEIPGRKPLGMPFFPIALVALGLIVGALFYSQKVTGESAGTPTTTTTKIEGPSGEPTIAPTEPVRRLGILLNQSKEPPPPKPDLVITENERTLLPDNGVRLFGAIRNQGNATAEYIRIRIRALDEKGNVLDEIEVPLRPSDLDPDQTGFYEILFSDIDPPSSVETEVFWNNR